MELVSAVNDDSGIVEADDEAHTHHFTRGNDVEARSLLVEEGDLGGVLHQLTHVEGPQTPGGHRFTGEPYPAG